MRAKTRLVDVMLEVGTKRPPKPVSPNGVENGRFQRSKNMDFPGPTVRARYHLFDATGSLGHYSVVEISMRHFLGLAAAIAALVSATGAEAGPEMHRAGLKACATLAQHNSEAYTRTAAMPASQRQASFDALKTQQSTERMQNALKNTDELESFVTSLSQSVQRGALLLAIDEPSLSREAAQGKLFDQCSVQVRPLLDLPGR